MTQERMEERFNIDCNSDYQYLDIPSFYTIKVKQLDTTHTYCVLEPKIPNKKEIEDVSISVIYEEGGENSYVGFYSNCGEIQLGFWIDGDSFIYTSNNENFDLGALPNTKNDFYEIHVTWGSPIRINVNGKEYGYPENPGIFECSSYPTDLAIGVWMDGGQSITTGIDIIEVNVK
jgi:hypothetical protein